MAGKKLSALNAFVKGIKDETKAEKSPSATLKKIIDDYCLSGKFDAFFVANKAKLLDYIADNGAKRGTKHRASQVGKCAQASAFKLAQVPETPIRATRPATQARALHNGTFVHLRYHVLFDALHAEGSVKTLYAENLAVNPDLSLSGTVDRVIEFDYLGATFRAVVDYKSIKAHYFDQLIKPQVDHTWQQHAYDLLGIYKADAWMMIYENKDNHELKIYDRPYDEMMLHRIVRNMLDIEKFALQYVSGSEITVDLPLTVDWCRYCPYESLCLHYHPDLIVRQANVGEEEDPIF